MENDVFTKIVQNIIKIFQEKGLSNIKIDFDDPTKNKNVLKSNRICAVVYGIKEDALYKRDVVVINLVDNKLKYKLPLKKNHHREVLYYTKISPIFEALQDEFELCLPQEIRLILPKCLGICGNMSEKLIVIENLKTKGYEIMKRKELDYEHAVLIFRAIGKFHALSFIYNKRYPEGYKEIIDHLSDDLLQADDEYNDKYLNEYLNKTYETLISVIDDESRKKSLLKHMDKKPLDKIKEIKNLGKIKAIIHGNNCSTSHRYKYQEQKAVDIVPLDYQWIRYGSIGYDIVYLFVFSAHADLRREHFLDLVKEYYSSFGDFVSICGYDAENFFTYNDLWDEIKEQSLFAILWAMLFLTTEENCANPWMKVHDVNEIHLTDEHIKNVNSLIKDWNNLGFI